MTTKKELEQRYNHVYYFKLKEQNPLTLREPGQTIRLGNTRMNIEETGEVELEGEPHGFLAGKEAEQ